MKTNKEKIRITHINEDNPRFYFDEQIQKQYNIESENSELTWKLSSDIYKLDMHDFQPTRGAFVSGNFVRSVGLSGEQSKKKQITEIIQKLQEKEEDLELCYNVLINDNTSTIVLVGNNCGD
jgi:hypothetical protein